MYVILVIVAATIVTYILAKVVSSIAIFPGQIFANVKNLKSIQLDEKDLDVFFSEEKTQDNRTLHTVKISPLKPSGNVIIIFNGQNATFRNEKKLKTYCQLAKDTGHTVIGFDYGGTGLKRVTTWSYQALVNDGFYLSLKTFKTMNENSALILKGNSIGGAIATKVAKLCHDAGIKAYLWNGRSFKSTSAVVAGQIQTLHISGHYENRITKTLSTMVEPIVSLLLRLTQFEITVLADYINIPTPYKNYYIVRSNKNQRLFKRDDAMIPYCATLDADRVIKIGNTSDPTDIAYFESRRKVTSILAKNAHHRPETELFCRKEMELSAYGLFCLFSKVYVEKHRQDKKNNRSPFEP